MIDRGDHLVEREMHAVVLEAFLWPHTGHDHES
jgi:hypothetical protein